MHTETQHNDDEYGSPHWHIYIYIQNAFYINERQVVATVDRAPWPRDTESKRDEHIVPRKQRREKKIWKCDHAASLSIGLRAYRVIACVLPTIEWSHVFLVLLLPQNKLTHRACFFCFFHFGAYYRKFRRAPAAYANRHLWRLHMSLLPPSPLLLGPWVHVLCHKYQFKLKFFFLLVQFSRKRRPVTNYSVTCFFSPSLSAVVCHMIYFQMAFSVISLWLTFCRLFFSNSFSFHTHALSVLLHLDWFWSVSWSLRWLTAHVIYISWLYVYYNMLCILPIRYIVSFVYACMGEDRRHKDVAVMNNIICIHNEPTTSIFVFAWRWKRPLLNWPWWENGGTYELYTIIRAMCDDDADAADIEQPAKYETRHLSTNLNLIMIFFCLVCRFFRFVRFLCVARMRDAVIGK